MFLENSVKVELLQERGVHFKEQQIRLARMILKYFDPDIRKIEGTKLIVSSLILIRGGALRCLNTTGSETNPDSLRWHDCSEEEEETHTEGKIAKRQVLEKELFYGQINRKVGRFCIRDCREIKVGGVLRNGCDPDLPGHLKTAGAQCYNGYNTWTLTLIATFYTKMPVPPTPETVDHILNNGCGPPKDKGGDGKFNRSQVSKIKRKLVEGNIKFGSGSTTLKIPNDEEALRTFLLKCADEVEVWSVGKKGSVNPAAAKKWFETKGDLFRYLVLLGDEDPKDRWEALKAGIRKMSLPELQRMVFYGTLAKVPLCMFLCSWFNDNNLLIDDNYCGSGKKPKPPPPKKKPKKLPEKKKK